MLDRGEPGKVELPPPPAKLDFEGKKPPLPKKKPAFETEAARYGRDYSGRGGWSPGAIWDSLLYLFKLMGSGIRRRLARRKARRDLAGQDTVMEERLIDLGRVALFLDGFEPRMIAEYQEKLEKLEPVGGRCNRRAGG